MTSINRIFKDELQEFEALLEDNDQQDGYFPKISNSAHIKITNDFMGKNRKARIIVYLSTSGNITAEFL